MTYEECAKPLTHHVKVGDDVEVLISRPYDWGTHAQPDPEWDAGYVVTGITGATDRDYRLDVDGPKKWRAIAPECVRRASGTSR